MTGLPPVLPSFLLVLEVCVALAFSFVLPGRAFPVCVATAAIAVAAAFETKCCSWWLQKTVLVWCDLLSLFLILDASFGVDCVYGTFRIRRLARPQGPVLLLVLAPWPLGRARSVWISSRPTLGQVTPERGGEGALAPQKRGCIALKRL